jgi:hypothetical protein
VKNDHKGFHLDTIFTRLDQLHGVLSAVYLCRDDTTGEFNCAEEIVVHSLDAAIDLVDDAREAVAQYIAKQGGIQKTQEVSNGQ